MNIIRLKNHRLSEAQYRGLISALRNGGVIVYPTDTVYGLGADIRRMDAIQKIFRIKKRDAEKALSIIASDVNEVETYAIIDDLDKGMFAKYWPGAVTFVLPKTARIPMQLSGNSDTVGIRIPDDPFVRRLAADLAAPLVSTSVNISGQTSMNDPQIIEDFFRGKKDAPDILIDGGKVSGRVPSTVVRRRGSSWEILRQGKVSVKEAERA
ncbi:MAG: threonylcarbamoyl-AMP synthase [Parcubacteria group bacterium]|nr:threonylcarbamoyl-AMP synthase [Parcubacteria group bacterium]